MLHRRTAECQSGMSIFVVIVQNLDGHSSFNKNLENLWIIALLKRAPIWLWGWMYQYTFSGFNELHWTI